jgi:hypothetical protein
VEWSENVTDALENPTHVIIEKLDDTTRRITIKGGDKLADISL